MPKYLRLSPPMYFLERWSSVNSLSLLNGINIHGTRLLFHLPWKRGFQWKFPLEVNGIFQRKLYLESLWTHQEFQKQRKKHREEFESTSSKSTDFSGIQTTKDNCYKPKVSTSWGLMFLRTQDFSNKLLKKTLYSFETVNQIEFSKCL